MNRRYERELRDLLAGMDGPPPREPGWRRWLRKLKSGLNAFGLRMAQMRRERAASQMIMASFGLALLVLLVGGLLRGALAPFGLVVALLFAVGYFTSFFEGRRRHQPLWRGRVIEYRRRPRYPWDSWFARLKRWRL